MKEEREREKWSNHRRRKEGGEGVDSAVGIISAKRGRKKQMYKLARDK